MTRYLLGTHGGAVELVPELGDEPGNGHLMMRDPRRDNWSSVVLSHADLIELALTILREVPPLMVENHKP